MSTDGVSRGPKRSGCLSLVMTPDCINGACPFVLSSAAAGLALQANRGRVRETTAKDVAVRAMVAAMVAAPGLYNSIYI